MSRIYENKLNYRSCIGCTKWTYCFLRKMPLHYYPESVQGFMISLPSTAVRYEIPANRWYGNYQVTQDQIIKFYNTYNCRLIENEYRHLSLEEQKDRERDKIRKLFKQYIDAAAEDTKDKNPELSIWFVGIGLVLADDLLEAINKIFSLFDRYEKITANYNNCLRY